MYFFRIIVGLLIGLNGLNLVLAAQVPLGVFLAKKQEVVRHIKDEPSSLDPAKVVGLTGAQIVRDLFEGLVNQDEQGRPIPGVAQSWENKNNQYYIFKLRENAKWANGDPVTAYDFVYSWQRLVDPKTSSPTASIAILAGINHAGEIIHGKMAVSTLGVMASDARTLVVQLDKPVPFFINLLANFSLLPVPQKTVEKYGNDWTKPEYLVGNGAFTLQERVVNEKIVLKPNPYYWDHLNTILTKVTFMPVNQVSTAVKRYLAGDIDITESFPKEMYHELLKKIPSEVYTPDQLGTYYYAFNTRKPPLNDVRVRRALSYAIDRQIIATKVLGTKEKPAYEFTPDVTADFTPGTLQMQEMTQFERDQQAKTWLAGAGYNHDNPLKLTLLYNTSENNQNIAIAVASMWKKTLGVEVKLTHQEWKTYIDSRNTGRFDVIRASWVGDYNEASAFLSLLTSEHTGNITQFSDPDYDKLLTQASLESDAKKRNAYYVQAEKILAAQAPIAPIYQYTNGRLIKPWIKGYPINNPEDMSYSRTLYVVDKQ